MIALIDYGMGNLLSVSKALEAVGGKIEIVEKAADVAKADAVILPGVGSFGDAIENLRSFGLENAVIEAINSGKPYLGICLGMQMLLDTSEEAPGVKGMGVFKGSVLRFPEQGLKVPHMGWNNITIENKHPLTNGIEDNSFFYFVHSYYVAPEDPSITAASCEYILKFTAAIGSKNVFATQFHPEKSQDKGLTILKNFVAQCNR